MTKLTPSALSKTHKTEVNIKNLTSARAPRPLTRAPRPLTRNLARNSAEAAQSLDAARAGSYPIERPTDEAQLQPLAVAAASEDGLEGAAAARDALASGVSEELAAQIDVLQVGLALQMSLHHIPLAEYEEHWGTACMIKMLTRAEFLFRVSGRTMHMSPPTRDLPEGLGERDNETRVFFFHYPPPPSARYGYTDPDGHATDDSTGFCEMAAQSAVPEGVSYPWICQNDISTDLFECATDYKGADGTDFSYKKHYLGSLSAEEETEDETTKVELLAAMMVADRMLRGRSGAIAYVAGEQPDLYAPALLEKAAAMATEELQSEDASAAAYMVRRPTDLPKAERATSKKAKKGEVGTASRVDHTCQALRAMPIDQRKRNDATITQVQGGILAGVPVRFFESLADKTEGGVGARLRGDTLAMTALHPYTGPFPPTNETEAAAREAAISAAQSERKRGGKELVEKAEAGDEEAVAESKRKASAGLEPAGQAAAAIRQAEWGPEQAGYATLESVNALEQSKAWTKRQPKCSFFDGMRACLAVAKTIPGGFELCFDFRVLSSGSIQGVFPHVRLCHDGPWIKLAVADQMIGVSSNKRFTPVGKKELERAGITDRSLKSWVEAALLFTPAETLITKRRASSSSPSPPSKRPRGATADARGATADARGATAGDPIVLE